MSLGMGINRSSHQSLSENHWRSDSTHIVQRESTTPMAKDSDEGIGGNIW